MPRGILTRQELALERERLDRRAREARLRQESAERAERERIEAEHRRREAAERRRQAEEEARRLAEERAREAEARRQAEAERPAFIEAQQRAEEKERRHQDVGAQDALARAERERQEAERAESDRIAALEARRRAEDLHRQAEARRREEERRRLANLRESREAARQRLARRNPIEGNRNNRPDDTRFVFDRRLDDDPAPPLPTKQLVDRDGSMRRETTGQATSRDDGATGRRNRTWRGSLKDTLPQRAHGVARHSAERCNGNAGERITPPGVYVVKRGDSLWKIARRHYNRGSLYPIIHRLNKRKIRRARLIYHCQRFRLPKQRFR